MANRSNSKSPPSLREQAEAAWQGRRRDPATIAPEDAGALVHELEVHQIELELQNEETSPRPERARRIARPITRPLRFRTRGLSDVEGGHGHPAVESQGR